MAAPKQTITPPDRVERWRKLWGTPRKLSTSEAEAAFEEFQEGFVRRHMRKMFLKSFGHPKATFGVRFFLDDVVRQNWKTRLDQIIGIEGGNVEVTIIYASPEAVEAHVIKGERRRSLREIVVDDWHAACAIIRSSSRTIYLFIEPKMNGCLTRTAEAEGEMADDFDEIPKMIEHDEEVG